MIGGEEDAEAEEHEDEIPAAAGGAATGGANSKKPKKQETKKKEEAEEILEFAKQLSALNVMHFEKKIERGLTGIELQRAQFAKKIFEDPMLLQYATTMFLAMKFGKLGKQIVTSIVVKFVEFISKKSEVDPVVMNSFTNIV